MINILQRKEGDWRGSLGGEALDDEGESGGQAEDYRHYHTAQAQPLLTPGNKQVLESLDMRSLALSPGRFEQHGKLGDVGGGVGREGGGSWSEIYLIH